MRLDTFALKQRTIFGRRSPLVDAHGNAVELPIAFEPDQDAVAQLMASTQERITTWASKNYFSKK